MKRKQWLWAVALIALLSTAACATVNPDQTTLREWRRSYLPTRLG